jgi:hypothetical protein
MAVNRPRLVELAIAILCSSVTVGAFNEPETEASCGHEDDGRRQICSSARASGRQLLLVFSQSAGGHVQFGPKTESQTATVDGEDLLTPIVMRAAEALVTYSAGK